jgi:hypothetical protein
MTPEICSVAGQRSGIAAFIRGDQLSHVRLGVGWSVRKPICRGFGCWEGFGSARA